MIVFHPVVQRQTRTLNARIAHNVEITVTLDHRYLWLLALNFFVFLIANAFFLCFALKRHLFEAKR